jgi:hypothetical protein
MTPAAKNRAKQAIERAGRLKDGRDVLGVDGIVRPVEIEHDINATFARLFANDGGKKVIDYLRSVTVNNVQGPATPDGELRHLEGQRFLAALIERRIDLGQRRKPELPAATATAAGARKT